MKLTLWLEQALGALNLYRFLLIRESGGMFFGDHPGKKVDGSSNKLWFDPFF